MTERVELCHRRDNSGISIHYWVFDVHSLTSETEGSGYEVLPTASEAKRIFTNCDARQYRLPIDSRDVFGNFDFDSLKVTGKFLR